MYGIIIVMVISKYGSCMCSDDLSGLPANLSHHMPFLRSGIQVQDTLSHVRQEQTRTIGRLIEQILCPAWTVGS